MLVKEAEYTFTIGKPFIPLILQEKYKPDGWLGILLGAKIFIDFKKFSFDECSKRLKYELEKICSNNIKIDTSKENEKKMPRKSHSIQSWSVAEVQCWLAKNGICEDITALLRNFDGEMLANLNAIRLTAPDYFFASVSKNNKIDLFSVVKFNKDFSNLFK